MDVAALIPAYNPDLRLLGLVQELLHSGRLAEIIVVDDGSGAHAGRSSPAWPPCPA